ncbi:hypothetical protein B566_EDAN006837 [Ephemera danica]|nr:hypothetical protein B566_EDAN006837 [Ephemera danica]
MVFRGRGRYNNPTGATHQHTNTTLVNNAPQTGAMNNTQGQTTPAAPSNTSPTSNNSSTTTCLSITEDTTLQPLGGDTTPSSGHTPRALTTTALAQLEDPMTCSPC